MSKCLENLRPSEAELNAYVDEVSPLPTSPTKPSRPWIPVWDIKTQDDLDRLMERCETVKKGTGAVLRLKGPHEEQQVKRGDDRKELPPLPEWNAIGVRGETAQLIYAHGLPSKAYRYGRCGRYGIPLQGHGLQCKFKEKSFGRYRCSLRFCDLCGPANYRRLFERYAPAIGDVVARESSRCGYVLARVNWTIRATGEMPTTEEIRWFNAALRKHVKGILPKGAVSGVILDDEFGYEKRGHIAERKAGGLNLHAHGLYFGPYLDWQKARDLWTKLTGSTGFFIKEIRGWRGGVRKSVSRALGHLLKYVSKMPVVSPERIAAFEKAFDGVRRVHCLGLFYGLPPGPKEERRCPGCGNILFPSRPFELCLVSDLVELGWADIDSVRLELNRSRVFGGGP